MKNALIYTVIFAAIQVVVSFSVQGVYMLIDGPGAKMDATGLIITMAVFSVVPVDEVGRGVASLGAYASLGGALLVCVGCAGCHHSFYLVAGADA